MSQSDPTGLAGDSECDGFCQTATAIYAGVYPALGGGKPQQSYTEVGSNGQTKSNLTIQQATEAYANGDSLGPGVRGDIASYVAGQLHVSVSSLLPTNSGYADGSIAADHFGQGAYNVGQNAEEERLEPKSVSEAAAEDRAQELLDAQYASATGTAKLPTGPTYLSQQGSPTAGGGGSLDFLSSGDLARIQNAANRTGITVNVVGSRAAGTAGPMSDWDYILEGGTARTRSSIRTSLPEGPRGLGEPRNQDFFNEPLDPSRPYIQFRSWDK